ncbi:MAG: hypothetical protein ACYTFY_16445 [Planctomycetota bacterium]|jgi:hypothetical protein
MTSDYDSSKSLLSPDWTEGNKEWKSGTISWNSSGAAKKLWFFAFFISALITPAVVTGLPEMLEKEKYFAIAVVSIFVLLAIGFICYAAYATMIAVRYGTSKLEMQTNPGILGGFLKATLNAPLSLDNPETIKLILTCTRYVVSGSGKNRGVRQNVYWRDEAFVPFEDMSKSTDSFAVPVFFPIPADLPESRKRSGDEWITWSLGAYAAVPGVDYQATFTIPVFETGKGDKTLTREMILSEKDKIPAAVPQSLENIQLYESPGKLDLIVPPLRRPFSAIIYFLITGGFGFGSYAAYENNVMILAPIALALFGLLMLAIGIHWLIACADLRISGSSITLKSGWLGLRKELFFTTEDVEKIKTEITMHQAADQKNDTGDYTIDITLKDGTKHSIADITPEKEIAEYITDRLKEHCSLTAAEQDSA